MARTNRRRQSVCESHWPDYRSVTYYHKNEKGFCTIPRTLPMIASLIQQISTVGDSSKVYIELWSRMFDPAGFVEITDEEQCANACGYMSSTSRAIRSWRERIDELERLGFIRVAGWGTRKRAYILLLHPHQAVQQLRQSGFVTIPEPWWQLFKMRLAAIGSELPPLKEPESVEEITWPESDDFDDDPPF